MSKSIKIGEKEYTIRELTIDEGLDMSQSTDPKEKTFEFVVKCVSPAITIEELKQMPFREGLALITAVNDVNGLSDFQNPVRKD